MTEMFCILFQFSLNFIPIICEDPIPEIAKNFWTFTELEDW